MSPPGTRRSGLRALLASSIVLGIAPAAGAAGEAASISPDASPEISLAVPRHEHHAFAGVTAEIPVVVRGRAGRAEALRGRWSVRTGALSAPLGGPFPIEIQTAQSTRPSLPVPVPVLRREVLLELQIEARSDATWRLVGRIPLRAYPTDLLEPLRQFAMSHPIDVRDGDGTLSQFFRAQNVPTHRQRDAWSAPAALTVFAGREADEWNQRAESAKRDAWQMVLRTEPDDATGRPPHVVIERRGAGGTVVAYLPSLRDLDHNPQSQSALVGLFALLHEQRSQEGPDR